MLSDRRAEGSTEAALLGDRYEMGPTIGRGGMAEVRAGIDTRLDRPVALKLLRSDLAHQAEVRRRFETEARLAARLSHPNVVGVYDSGEQDGVPFIVMERLSGETLQDRLAAGPMRADEVSAVAAQVLSALESAHSAGVLHRDIKPGNILSGPAGQWKVADFGIAKALEVDSGDMTAAGLLIGTPAYLAPERFFGAPATVSSDLYSLAVVLYEALAGTKPFRSSRPEAWASLVAGTRPRPLHELRPGVDPALLAVIERGMAKEPADRYPSAAAMADALRAGGGERPAAVAGGPAVDPTVAMAGADPTAAWGQPAGPPATDVLPVAEHPYRRAATTAPPGGPGGRRRLSGPAARVAAAAAAALLVIAVVAVALSGGHHSAGTRPPASATTAPAASATTVPATGGPTGPGPAAGSAKAVPSGLQKAINDLGQQVKR